MNQYAYKMLQCLSLKTLLAVELCSLLFMSLTCMMIFSFSIEVIVHLKTWQLCFFHWTLFIVNLTFTSIFLINGVKRNMQTKTHRNFTNSISCLKEQENVYHIENPSNLRKKQTDQRAR